MLYHDGSIMQKLNTENNGFALLAVLLSVSVLLLIATFAARICIINICLARDELSRVRTFYLAESGIEQAKSLIAADASWSTDPSHSSADKNWLLCGATGKIYFFGAGGFKIVKESGKQTFYGIGFIGTDILRSRAYSFQEVDYEMPFRQKTWKEL